MHFITEPICIGQGNLEEGMRRDEEFYARVIEALTGCQRVEATLRLYIEEALRLVKRQVAGRLPFKIDRKSVV